VTVVITDGMRVDTSETLPSLNALRVVGESAVLRTEFPSFSRVGYANLLTGCGPRVHGYLSNHNKRPSPVESIADVARAAGIHTRFFADENSWIPAMFPKGFDEVHASKERTELDFAQIAAAPRPHFTVIYLREPDLVAHVHGAASEEYRQAALAVDATIGRIAAGIDLSREALFVVSDHGHLARGGHGGHEPEVMWTPAVAAGRGATIEGARRHRDLAPRVCRILGIRWPNGARIAEEGDPPSGRYVRLALAFVVLTAFAFVLRGPRPQDILAAIGGVGVAGVLYWIRGYPFSFSCVNSESDIALFVVEVLAYSAVGILAGSYLVRSGWRYAMATYLAGAIVAGVTGAVAGPTAATGLDHPAASYMFTLSLCYLVAAGLLVKVHDLLGRSKITNEEGTHP
jgi:hypothetical protein